MTEMKITAGMKREVTAKVTDENTAIAMKAAELVDELVPDDWTSVGVSLDIQHKAATALGRNVRAEAEVERVDGRQLTFVVKAFDDAGEIGEGLHQRVLVNREKFMGKVTAK